MRTPWHSPSLRRWLRANVKGVFAPRRISPGLWLFRPCIRHFDNHPREQARKGFYFIQGKSADSYEGEAPDDRMRHGRPYRTPRRLDPGTARRLRAQRVLVLEPDGVSIRMAPPFSGVSNQHVVIVDETKYFANCAWDSFGIPAALHRPGRVHSRCEQSVNRSIWRLAWKVRRLAVGFFIALFPLPGGGTTLFSPEATCFSSGRKNGFWSGAPRMAIPCGR